MTVVTFVARFGIARPFVSVSDARTFAWSESPGSKWKVTLEHWAEARQSLSGIELRGMLTMELQDEPRRSVFAGLLALARGEEPAGTGPEGQGAFDKYPIYLREYLLDTLSRITRAARDFLGILAWRTGAQVPQSALAYYQDTTVAVGNDGPTRLRPNIGFGLGTAALHPELTEEVVTSMQALLAQADREPTSHELLREAWYLLRSAPRAALVLGVAAAEVGVKEHVTAVVPPAGWLVMKLPAPPIADMIDKYLPSLPSPSGITRPFDKEVRKTIRRAVDQRNALVHRGEYSVDGEDLLDLLVAVGLLLRELAYRRGLAWMKTRSPGPVPSTVRPDRPVFPRYLD